jgi:DNA polymerase I-like protein with 3'-5' exonuclease and polymerase domains
MLPAGRETTTGILLFSTSQVYAMIAIDSECTGLDLRHGAKPFFVTTCNGNGVVQFWCWDVDPTTREPEIPSSDLHEIAKLLGLDRWYSGKQNSVEVVMQNGKFDVAALSTVEPEFANRWPWAQTQDTLVAAHLLASNLPHDLTSLASQYLGIDIQPFEDRLEKAVQDARRWCRSHYPHWAIAKKGRSDMPSAKEKTWKYDTWLPRALCVEEELSESHPWWTVLRDYANTDSSVTVELWKVMQKELRRRGLEKLYAERMKLVPIIYGMESHGITLSKERLDTLKKEFGSESERLGRVCVSVADSLGHKLQLPAGATPNGNLRTFCFDVLKLPKTYSHKAKTNAPTLDKNALDNYLATLEPRSKGLGFIRALTTKRKYDTGLSYLESYEKFWRPLRTYDTDLVEDISEEVKNWYILHPSLNQTGTDTLRMSCNNPNLQQVDKHERTNLRRAFGPAPGREWYKADAENLELRIPTFEADERDLMEVFLKPKEPPYYGSYHLVVFDLLHPDLFKQYGKGCKDKFDGTWYQWVKNGNFSVIYGAQEETADRTYHVQGAYKRIRHRFPKIAALNDRLIRFAEKHGYVETIPDKSIDPLHGYPILCSRTEWGRVLPTVPLNYHVQSTACWWMARAMVRCEEKLQGWCDEMFDGYMVLQVHDELIFDFPKYGNPIAESKLPHSPYRTSNLWRARILQKCMERGGEDIGVPTPVSVKYVADNWGEGVGV